MEEVKRIPYGVSNFVEVVEQNQYYVDKTMYLPLLEKQPSNLFFIRPRRGRSRRRKQQFRPRCQCSPEQRRQTERFPERGRFLFFFHAQPSHRRTLYHIRPHLRKPRSCFAKMRRNFCSNN